MKNIKFFFFIGLLAATLFSCESDDEKYNGSPVGKDDIITLDGIIQTTVTAAMNNQKIPFTVTLPRTFSDTVSVEVSTKNRSGASTRVSVDILPGDVTISDEIPCAGGAIYNSSVDLSITAINLKTVEQGKHYLIKSNVITLETGDTSVPSSDNTKLQVRFAVPESGSTLNNIRLYVTRPDNTVSVPGNESSTPTRLYSVTNGASNSVTSSGLVGEYILKIAAFNSLVTSPVDLPYRFVVRFPDGSSKLFQGIYPALTLSSPQLPVLRIVKTEDPVSHVISYDVTQI